MSVVAAETGLAGWLLRSVRGIGQARAGRQLELIETLSLGGKRQLMLVRCGDETFLIGAGADSVQTPVRLESSVAL